MNNGTRPNRKLPVEGELTMFWKSLMVVTSTGVLTIMAALLNFWGDWSVVKENVATMRKVQGSIGFPTENDDGRISGTMLSEAVGTRKNLEVMREDIGEIREAVQDIRNNMNDIKQSLLFNQNGNE